MNYSKEYAKISNKLGYKICKKGTMELGKRIWKKSSKELGTKAGKKSSKKQGKRYVNYVVRNLSRKYAKVARNWAQIMQN